MNDHMTDAQLAEWKLATQHQLYERVKLVLMTVVLILNLTIGGLILQQSAQNGKTLDSTHETLNILRCAVARDVRNHPDGTPRSSKEAQARFEACVKGNGPPPNQP